MDQALAALGEFLAQNPDAAERYDESDVKHRYMHTSVPVATLAPGDFPADLLDVLLANRQLRLGRFAMNCYQGKYKKMNVPARTPANAVVVRLTTAERKQESRKWIGIDFTPVGVFNPSDYGLDPNEVVGN